jgi:hypothetical protein
MRRLTQPGRYGHCLVCMFICLVTAGSAMGQDATSTPAPNSVAIPRPNSTDGGGGDGTSGKDWESRAIDWIPSSGGILGKFQSKFFL